MIDYFTAASDPISDCEQMLYVLGNLDSNFAPLVTNITGKERILSLDKYFAHLRMQGRYQDNMSLPDPHVIKAKTTTR